MGVIVSAVTGVLACWSIFFHTHHAGEIEIGTTAERPQSPMPFGRGRKGGTVSQSLAKETS